MTKKKSSTVEPTAEEKAAAEAAHLKECQAIEAERVRVREAEAKAAAEREEAEAKARRAIALIDADGVLIGKIQGPTDAEWNKAPAECRFPNGFDNALHRYQLTEWKPGRFRFEPITHAKDTAAENAEGSPKILAPIARAVVALASAQTPAAGDVGKLVDFLKSFDAQGN